MSGVGFVKSHDAEWFQPAQRECDAQGERPAGVGRRLAAHLGDPAQPVAHGIRVHEKAARGGFERTARVEEGGDRVDQHVPCRDEWLVDGLDELLPGVRVAGEGSFRQ